MHLSAFASVAVAAVLAAAPAQADAPFQRGFTVMGWTAGSYLTERSDRIVTRMANDGSSHMDVFTQWFMDSTTSSTIAPDPQRTPSDAAVLHAIATARRAGMTTVVKPQLGIRDGSWIGFAHPQDLDLFWSDYRAMLLHYADLAEQAGVSMLVVGTEMRTLSGDETRWRTLIADVRRHFHGELTYAANYDEFARVPFWDALDYIGIDAYFGLADASDPSPSVDALTSAWSSRGYLAGIAAVSRRTGKKVVFTEIGYRGISSTAAAPNRWDVDGPADGDAQGRAYEAFYRAVARQPWMAGVYWWGLDVDKWWIKDYSPLGKPAEQIMSAWNALTAPAVAVAGPEPAAQVDQQPVPAPTAAPTQSVPQSVPQTLLQTIAQVPPAPVLASRPVIRVTLRQRRVAGHVSPFRRACGGSVRLELRHANASAARRLTVSAAGRFSSRLPRGRVLFRARYSSRCASAASRWITARG